LPSVSNRIFFKIDVDEYITMGSAGASFHHDGAAKAIADTGGVICAAGVGLFLNPEGEATMETLAEHVNYVGDLSGHQQPTRPDDNLFSNRLRIA